MKVPRNLRLELGVAVFTLLVAGAFTQAAVTDRPAALFLRVEQTAQALGKKVFLGHCAACHGQNAADARIDEKALTEFVHAQSKGAKQP